MRELLSAWSLDDVSDAVVLLTSELVTNVLLHTADGGQLLVQREGGGVRVTVIDMSPVLPAQRRYSSTATTGRGCRLMNDLADEWGAEPQGSGKAVWFVISGAEDPWAAFDADALLADADL